MPIGRTAPSARIAAALGAASAPVVALIVAPAVAQNTVTAAVSIDNFRFNPAQLTVKAGTAVTWTNKDDIPHGIAWSSNVFPRSKALDTNDSTRRSHSRRPGYTSIFCYTHPHMVGTVVVQVATGSNEK